MALSRQFHVQPGQFYGQYTAHMKEGGRQIGFLAVREWDDMPTPEVGDILVSHSQKGKGAARQMLDRALQDYPDLSHSRKAMTAEGALYSIRTPLPGDDEGVRRTQRNAIKPISEASRTLLGGAP